MMRRNWGIGVRLAIGFGLVIALLGGFATTMYWWQAASIRAQDAYIERLAPLSAHADALERRVLRVAIAVRNAIIAPDGGRHAAALESIELARQALHDVEVDARTRPDRALYETLAPAVRAYLDSATVVVAQAVKAQPLDEIGLSAQREGALVGVQRLADAQDGEMKRAVAAMAEARDASRRSFAVAFALVLGVLLASAVVIIHSIRSPARRLVLAAQALEAGDWRRALALLPDAGSGRAHDGELGEIGAALATAALALEDREHRLKKALEELQARNEAIQAQSEELQAQSEELQAQGEELQVQQEELQAQNDQIQQQNDELQRQAAQLMQADLRKNEFLGLLAHELRNPLAAISNSIFVLNHVGSAPGQVAASRRVIERQMRQLTRMVDDLLDVTRISQGKVRLKREVIDLSRLVHDCAEDHRASAEAAGLALDADITDGLSVDADRARVAQVLGNLLMNAIKFTDRGGRIRLVLREEAERDGVMMEVADTGMGIDPQLMKKLFVPFSQGELGLARGNGGLGLGLALARALVELHGGSIEAHSEGRGKGARFSARLPRTRTETDTPAQGAAPRSVRSRRVLLVEDNADAAESLALALSLQGHEVQIADCGEHALQRLREYRPDVVLCDIGLPDIDGFEVARRIRADASFAAIVLVAMSGYASNEDRERAAEAGFDMHLAKPVEMERLDQLFAEVVPSLS